MRRDPVDRAVAAQLAALDRVFSGEPVGEEHLELAALVESVRADAPRLGEEGTARVAARVRARIGGRRSGGWAWRRATAARVGRPRRATAARTLPGARVALGFGGLGAAAAALAIVVVVAGGGTGTRPASIGAAASTPAIAQSRASSAPAAAPTPALASAPSAGGGAAAGSAPPFVSPAVPQVPAGRLQQLGASMTLASSASALHGVANGIVAATEQLGGFVQSSNVTVQGAASLATFQLSVPSSNLGREIAALSRLADVRALTQSTQDITSGYDQARSRLADSRAQRDALLVALAHATTANQTTSVDDRLDAVDGRIAADQKAVDGLAGQAHTAGLQVTVVPVAVRAPRRGSTSTLSRGAHAALRVLEVAAAVALVALAVLVPLLALALAAWLGVAGLRRRARERALERA